MNRRALWLSLIAGAVLVAVIAALTTARDVSPSNAEAPPAAGAEPLPGAGGTQGDARPLDTPEQIRTALFAEIQPVKVANCELERFGEAADGGYLLCGNLLGDVKAGYSYGINGYDGWGCDVTRKLSVPVHQYDCFNTTRPSCPGGRTVFHAECVAAAPKVEEGRAFDTMANQMAKNGDGSNRLVLKIDVEGAEWESFLHAPDELLGRIDQIAVEFHMTEEKRFVDVVRKLKRHFHVAHLHFNNWSCRPGLQPFPAWAYEVLFVNKRIAVVDAAGSMERPHRLDAPNNPNAADCQR